MQHCDYTVGCLAVPHARVQVGRLARRAEGKGKRDSTKYGSSRTSARTFFQHHVQQLSKAAVVGDAQAMRRREIRAGKQRAINAGGAAL